MCNVLLPTLCMCVCVCIMDLYLLTHAHTYIYKCMLVYNYRLMACGFKETAAAQYNNVK